MPLDGVIFSTDIQTSRHKDRRKGSLDVRSTTSRGSDGMLNQQIFFSYLYIFKFLYECITAHTNTDKHECICVHPYPDTNKIPSHQPVNNFMFVEQLHFHLLNYLKPFLNHWRMEGCKLLNCVDRRPNEVEQKYFPSILNLTNYYISYLVSW